MVFKGWDNVDPEVYDGYLGKITEFVLWLLDNGYRVSLLLCDAADQQAIDDIRSVIEAERPALQEQHFITESALSVQDVIRQVSSADIIVASRFHHLVFGLKYSKPTVSIGYDGKHDELMASMGMGAFCQRIESLEVDRLISQFKVLASERNRYEAIVRSAVISGQQRLSHQESVIASQFLGKAGLSAASAG